MTVGAYRAVPAFAYPGWRLSVPGGPAGGHYKGFTHTEAAGTDLLPQDEYEQDREDGMSSHDLATASPRNPRGVYRSSAEVPPRPNASGSLQTYRDVQTRRHAGTSEAPGSFPADYFETGEDGFLPTLSALLSGVGAAVEIAGGDPIISPRFPICPAWGCGGPPVYRGILPITVTGPNVTQPSAGAPCSSSAVAAPGWTCINGQWVATGDTISAPPPAPPSTGATSVVNQPSGALPPAPPSPSVPVYTAPPVSPAPAPVVATNEVVPLNDGSGNYMNLSTGQIVTPAQVQQNLATMQLTTGLSVASATSWLEQPSALIPQIPNWGLVAAAALGAFMLMGRRR